MKCAIALCLRNNVHTFVKKHFIAQKCELSPEPSVRPHLLPGEGLPFRLSVSQDVRLVIHKDMGSREPARQLRSAPPRCLKGGRGLQAARAFVGGAGSLRT